MEHRYRDENIIPVCENVLSGENETIFSTGSLMTSDEHESLLAGCKAVKVSSGPSGNNLSERIARVLKGGSRARSRTSSETSADGDVPYSEDRYCRMPFLDILQVILTFAAEKKGERDNLPDNSGCVSSGSTVERYPDRENSTVRIKSTRSSSSEELFENGVSSTTGHVFTDLEESSEAESVKSSVVKEMKEDVLRENCSIKRLDGKHKSTTKSCLDFSKTTKCSAIYVDQEHNNAFACRNTDPLTNSRKTLSCKKSSDRKQPGTSEARIYKNSPANNRYLDNSQVSNTRKQSKHK